MGDGMLLYPRDDHAMLLLYVAYRLRLGAQGVSLVLNMLILLLAVPTWEERYTT